MKIDLNSIDRESFNVKEGLFCGVESYLVIPKELGVKYTQFNKIFRSSIWDKEGNLISAGFKKFMNLGQQEEEFPAPKSLDNSYIIDKIDGSLCIIDYLNGIISMRTRGVFSYKTHENFSDFDYCLSKYPKINEWIKLNDQFSLLLEITSPRMKIVLDYGAEPDFKLIGAIDKNDYNLLTQGELDSLSHDIGIPRPQSYLFNNLNELIKITSELKDREGICLYSNNGQEIHKIKSQDYILKHSFKSNANFKNIVDLFFEFNCPTYDVFKARLINTFDFECFSMVSGLCLDICNLYDKHIEEVHRFNEYIDENKELDKKSFALKLLSGTYKDYSSFIFMLKEKKQLDKKMTRKLMERLLESNKS